MTQDTRQHTEQRDFASPDEVRAFDHGKLELLRDAGNAEVVQSQKEEDESGHQARLEPSCLPEQRIHLKREGGVPHTPNAIGVGRGHAESIGGGRQVGVGRLPGSHTLGPFMVKPLQQVSETNPLRSRQTKADKVERNSLRMSRDMRAVTHG